MYQIIIIVILIIRVRNFIFRQKTFKIEKSKTFCIVLYCLNRRIVIQESHKSCTKVTINNTIYQVIDININVVIEITRIRT